MSEGLFVRRGGGDAGPALLLLHGLGATGEVWDGLTALLPGHWPGSWIVPDLPGHGRSAPAPQARYSVGGLAAGEHDPMSPVEHLQALVPDPVVLKGLGHNAHVEDPAALLPLLDRLAASVG